MASRDDLTESVPSNPGAVPDAQPAPDFEQPQLDIRVSPSLSQNAPLLWIGLAYPTLNGLVLCLGVGAMGMLKTTNFYCFSFGLPILTVCITFLLRLANVLRYQWWAFDCFLAWMSLIGYLNMQLFFIAWSGV